MAKKEVAKKRIPVGALREFAKGQGLDIAVLLGWSKATGLQHVVTWGKTVELCDAACDMGNKVKELACWPDEECNAEPSRVRKLKKQVKELEARVKELDEQLEWQAREMGERDEMREAAEHELDQELDRT